MIREDHKTGERTKGSRPSNYYDVRRDYCPEGNGNHHHIEADEEANMACVFCGVSWADLDRQMRERQDRTPFRTRREQGKR